MSTLLNHFESLVLFTMRKFSPIFLKKQLKRVFMHYYLLYYLRNLSIILHYFGCPTVLNCDTIFL
jgi:hypothetical protein